MVQFYSWFFINHQWCQDTSTSEIIFWISSFFGSKPKARIATCGDDCHSHQMHKFPAPWWDDDEAVGDAGDVEVLPSVTVGLINVHLVDVISDISCLVVYLPLWKIWKSNGSIIPNIWKIKHVPNHQPVSDISDIRPSVDLMSFPTSVDQPRRKPGCPYYCWVPQKGSVGSRS